MTCSQIHLNALICTFRLGHQGRCLGIEVWEMGRIFSGASTRGVWIAGIASRSSKSSPSMVISSRNEPSECGQWCRLRLRGSLKPSSQSLWKLTCSNGSVLGCPEGRGLGSANQFGTSPLSPTRHRTNRVCVADAWILFGSRGCRS